MRPQGEEVLRIELAVEQGRLVTKWSGPLSGRDRIVPTQLPITQLADLRKKVGKNLQRVKTALGTALLQSSWGELRKALDKLQMAGDTFAFQLWGSERRGLQNLWRDSCFGWDRLDAPVPVVTIAGLSEYLLPFEILPCFQDAETELLARVKEADIGTHLVSFLRQFLGFSCIVKRVDGVAGEPSGRVAAGSVDLLQSDPTLPMKLFVCRSLLGVRREEERLGTLNKLDIDPWPTKGQRGDAAKLAGHLWHTRHTIQAKERNIPDQVHHFASHCSTSNADSALHSIGLAGCRRSRFSATLGAMDTAFGKLSRGDLPDNDCRPLVFVNACGSSRVSPDQVCSLPKLFLRQLRSRGYIGTETTMADEVASEFSYQFYHRLLHGHRLGESLHDTRWWLVRRYNNPLGLFYTCYANPELCVSHPLEPTIQT